MPFEKNNGNKPFKNQQSETKFSHWTDYSFQSWSDSLSKEAFIVNQRSDWHLWSSDNNFVSEDYFLENGFVASGRPNCLMYNNISSKLCNEFLKVESYVTDETARSGFPFDNREHCNGSQFRKNISKPLLQRCSSQRNWPLDKEMIEIDYGVESPIGSFKKKKQGCSNASFSMLEVSGETYHPFSKALWQDGESCSQIYPKRTGGIPRDFDFLISSAKLFLSCGGDVSVEANDLQFGSVTLAENSASHHQSLNMGTSNLLMQFSYKNETSKESTSNEAHDPCTSLVIGDKKPPQQSSSVHNLYFEPSIGKNRSNMDNKPDTMFGTIVKKCEKIEDHCLEDPELVVVQVSTSNGNQDPEISATKWKNSFQQNTSNSKLYDTDNEDNLVDIASGFLYLAAESSIPKSISKKCLTDAKVRQQVDKKFIPIVARGTLAIIDQVLSGEGKSVTYLDTEKELVYLVSSCQRWDQLLHTYPEPIRQWGWICDFRTQDSRSFKKNLILIHPKPAVVKLLAVPCILGVNLSDVDLLEILHQVPCILGVNLSDVDLLEILHQLADTDVSSTMPPSVSRILNCKACRALLVNLEALHKQIAKMQVRGDEPRELWHGLYRQRVSLERASLWLRAADGITN
ncbi:MUTL protein, putative isoform 3 [Hibiscus syriacus]|uniref:MUTL protein, putative isoform 3 n=1 Tax=Hibiscus syriacus TaxID=106335 RepID=A0A6A3ARG4_HIBSY|nr:MUTL protein, putative isoform 3 [Hibiscus syriacus]